MDLFERVRDIHLDDTRFTEVQKDAARQVLLRGLASKDRRPARSQRSWIGAAGLVGATAVAAIVVAVVVTPGAVTPAAAEVLNRAAEVTAEAQDPALAPGEYLRIAQTTRGTTLWDAELAPSGFGNSDPRAADAGFVEESTYETYVPADRSHDWVLTWSVPKLVDQFGDRAEEALAVRDSLVAVGSFPTETRTIERRPAGETPAQGEIGGDRIYDSQEERYADMPREPSALLAWFRAQVDEDEADHFVIQQLEDSMMVNLAPRDLRVALFRALAMIDGVSVASVKGNLTTLAYDWTFHDRDLQTTFIVDTDEGRIVGGSQVEITEGQPGFLPAPFVASEWTTKITVMASAP